MSVRLLLLFVLAFSFSASAKERRILKDGRQYAIDLGRRLQITNSEMMGALNDVVSNAPRSRDLSAMQAALPTFARIANYACEYVGYFESEVGDVDALYAVLLDRKATPAERSLAIQENGKLPYYANCMAIALSFEFITTVSR